eukprot:SAG22_NODE_21435_length_257_cov_0.651899_1_plen_80_part_10
MHINMACFRALLVPAAALLVLSSSARSQPQRPPVAVAHRGASGEAPENTMAAFRLALELGAAGVETDLHMTRDGVVVCLH